MRGLKSLQLQQQQEGLPKLQSGFVADNNEDEDDGTRRKGRLSSRFQHEQARLSIEIECFSSTPEFNGRQFSKSFLQLWHHPLGWNVSLNDINICLEQELLVEGFLIKVLPRMMLILNSGLVRTEYSIISGAGLMNSPESTSKQICEKNSRASKPQSIQVHQMTQQGSCAGTKVVWCAAPSISCASEKDEIMLCWKRDEHC